MKFDYVTVLLGGVLKLANNVFPTVALKGIKNKGEFQKLEIRRFLSADGITNFRHNSFFPVNTLQIMRGAVFARGAEFFDKYVDEVYRHM